MQNWPVKTIGITLIWSRNSKWGIWHDNWFLSNLRMFIYKNNLHYLLELFRIKVTNKAYNANNEIQFAEHKNSRKELLDFFGEI